MTYLSSRPMSLSVPLHPVLDFQRQYAMVLVTITSEAISKASYVVRMALVDVDVNLPRRE